MQDEAVFLFVPNFRYSLEIETHLPNKSHGFISGLSGLSLAATSSPREGPRAGAIGRVPWETGVQVWEHMQQEKHT